MTDRTFGTLIRGDPNVHHDVAGFTFSGFKPEELDKLTKDIPDSFDGRVVWKNYLSPIKNQRKCPSSWAYAMVGSLADKFALQTAGQVKRDLSPATMILCEYDTPSYYLLPRQELAKAGNVLKTFRDSHGFPGCWGNSLYKAARYVYKYGVMEEGCLLPEYEKRITNLMDIRGPLDAPYCEDAFGNDLGSCWDDKTASRILAACAYYAVAGDPSDGGNEKNVMFQIYRWGPLAAGIAIYKDFLKYDGKGIYVYDGRSKRISGHAVKIVGWGEENDIPYWIVANSWGPEWGDNGYFKIKRGTCELEKNIVGVIPNLPNEIAYPWPASSFLINIEDQILRNFFNLDMVTGYTLATLRRIASGELKSDDGRVLFIQKYLPPAPSMVAAELPEKIPEYPLPDPIDYEMYGFEVAKGKKLTHWINVLLFFAATAALLSAAFTKLSEKYMWARWVALGFIAICVILMTIALIFS